MESFTKKVKEWLTSYESFVRMHEPNSIDDAYHKIKITFNLKRQTNICVEEWEWRNFRIGVSGWQQANVKGTTGPIYSTATAKYSDIENYYGV